MRHGDRLNKMFVLTCMCVCDFISTFQVGCLLTLSVPKTLKVGNRNINACETVGRRSIQKENRSALKENRSTTKRNQSTWSENRSTLTENRSTLTENRSIRTENRSTRKGNRSTRKENGRYFYHKPT